MRIQEGPSPCSLGSLVLAAVLCALACAVAASACVFFMKSGTEIICYGF